MTRRVVLEASHAVAEAVKMADVDCIAAYPITPQTHIPERLAEMVADGDLDAAYIPVESEHSAMSAVLGSAAVGARSFTTTAAQGLALMLEAVYIASSHRYPIVMAVANRALSAPISIWCDHSDAMMARDVGWIQVFCQNNQEAFDMTLWGFRVGEDKDVMFPVMVHLDGFTLSHVTEPLLLPSQRDVDRFLPKYDYRLALRPESPTSHGGFGLPDIYTEVKYAQEVALRDARRTIDKAWDEYADIFGRRYSALEGYKTDGADTLILTMGSLGETAQMVVDRKRADGMAVGSLNLRLWRPFPFADLKEAVKGVKTLIVLDRAFSYGGPGGPVASEIRSALYDIAERPRVVGFVGALGGRDLDTGTFEYMIDRGREISEKGIECLYEPLLVRGLETGTVVRG
ncbi:MAG TPA: pyruvate ferredoxin oxidoreductase [Dehalococcoidia bacterium]|nr:pyruvate ferredoxin oxidoreductase [Dehalococcoidia bacterium]